MSHYSHNCVRESIVDASFFDLQAVEILADKEVGMIYQFGNCTFDVSQGVLCRAGEVVKLEPQALEVLRYLFEHRDRLIPYDELFEQCWSETYVGPSALTSALRRIRRALGQLPKHSPLIETIHRRGYQFVAEVTELRDVQEAKGHACPVPAAPRRAPCTVPRHNSNPAGTTERRHLTVLSCTLLEAKCLTQQLDLEDYYHLMQSFRATVLGIITEYGGYETRQVDDGMLVHFGYPQAHEDDAQRAVRSALALVGKLSRLVPVGTEQGLAVGIGIDTGMVIVSWGASQEAEPALAMGGPLTQVAQLARLAQAGTVVMSAATAQLVEGYVNCEALSDPAQKGQTDTETVYKVLGESAVQTRLEIGMTQGLTPFVGREMDMGLLRDRWAYVQEGSGQVVLLTGEAGIGKSRLVHNLRAQIADDQARPLECRCSLYHQNSAFYPLIDLMRQVFNLPPNRFEADQLETLEASLRSYSFPLQEIVPFLAGLLSLPLPEERYPPLHLEPARQRERTLDMLVTLLVNRSLKAPTLFIIEDLHWADPSTLDFVKLLLEQVATASILVVLTSRPHFEAPWSKYDWMTSVALNRLTRPQIHQMIAEVTGGKAFSAEVMEQLAEKTDGVPLFVEELIHAVLETGQFEETEENYELVGGLAELSIPATLHDSLASRLDRLGMSKDLAQWGSVIGREFSYELIQMVVPYEEAELQSGLDQLVESGLVFRRGLSTRAQYRFKHALVQDVAYESLLRRRRQAFHSQVAGVLAQQYPQTVKAQPEILARHYTEAGAYTSAVAYWLQAGQRAIQHSANHEAIAHLSQGLALLPRVTATPVSLQQELNIQTGLGIALIAAKGYGELGVEQAYARAHELCEEIGDPAQLIPILRGLLLYNLSRGNLKLAFELREQLFHLAKAQSDPETLMMVYQLMGHVSFYQGELASAYDHHRQVLAFYTPESSRSLVSQFGADLGAVCHSHMALELWQLGYPDQALYQSQVALNMGQESLHPYSQAITQCYTAILHQFRREMSAAHAQATATITLAAEKGFILLECYSTVIQGWCLVMKGEPQAGITKIYQGITVEQDTEVKIQRPYCLSLMADAYKECKKVEQGLSLVEEAIVVMEATGIRLYEAEVYRLKGELLLNQSIPDLAQAESCFRQAITIAQRQQAKSWELRAATSLARLWPQQGKRQDAYELLAPVYGWFTEGFDTADLQEAKVLLEEIHAGLSEANGY